MSRLYHYCDYCQNQMEADEEVEIVILELLHETYFFCCEDCMEDFLDDCSFRATLYSNGVIERD